MNCRKVVFTMQDTSRRKADRAGPRCQVPVQYVGADILVGVEFRKNPKANLTRQRGLLGSVSFLVAKLNSAVDTQRDSINVVSTNLTCRISLRVDGTSDEVPGADTHPRLRLAAKLSLEDVTPGKTR